MKRNEGRESVPPLAIAIAAAMRVVLLRREISR
jgi:hypothetical protein